MKLSIVVPIYGVEKYLRKCVDSLLAQDISDYEIILVDDGSPDSCPQICDEYVEKAKSGKLRAKRGADVPLTSDIQHQTSGFISVIHRENGGLSAARNSGIEVARGEYIMFVDSDDYLEPNVLGALMAQIERDNLDVLRYNYQNVNEKGEVFQPFKSIKPYFDYRNDVLDGETFLNERLGYACYAWAFVLRRNLLDGCQFTPGIYFEDMDWTPRMLLRAKRISNAERVVYNYLWRQGSITLPDNPEKKRKVLEDKILLLDGLKEHQKFVQNKKWFIWQITGTTMSILSILSTYPFAQRKPYLQRIKSKCVFPLSTYRANKKTKIKIWLVNISPSFFCMLMNLIRR